MKRQPITYTEVVKLRPAVGVLELVLRQSLFSMRSEELVNLPISFAEVLVGPDALSPVHRRLKSNRALRVVRTHLRQIADNRS